MSSLPPTGVGDPNAHSCLSSADLEEAKLRLQRLKSEIEAEFLAAEEEEESTRLAQAAGGAAAAGSSSSSSSRCRRVDDDDDSSSSSSTTSFATTAGPCASCGTAASLQCVACRIPYCSIACQRNDWKAHKPRCRPPFDADAVNSLIGKAAKKSICLTESRSWSNGLSKLKSKAPTASSALVLPEGVSVLLDIGGGLRHGSEDGSFTSVTHSSKGTCTWRFPQVLLHLSGPLAALDVLSLLGDAVRRESFRVELMSGHIMGCKDPHKYARYLEKGSPANTNPRTRSTAVSVETLSFEPDADVTIGLDTRGVVRLFASTAEGGEEDKVEGWSDKKIDRYDPMIDGGVTELTKLAWVLTDKTWQLQARWSEPHG